MQHDGISVSLLCGYQIKKKAQGIEYGCLDVSDQGSAGELVDVPERYGAVGHEVVVNELFQRVKIEQKIGAKQRLARANDMAKKYGYGYD